MCIFDNGANILRALRFLNLSLLVKVRKYTIKPRTSETTLRNEDNIWIANSAIVLSPIATSLGGILAARFGIRITCAIGCSILCAGVALTYFTLKVSLVWVSITYGLVNSFGNFIAYGPPAQNAVGWIPKRPTFAVGLIVCGFGGGAFIFNQVVTAFINPDNISPDLVDKNGDRYFTNKELLDRVPYAFLLLAGIYAVMCIVGVIMIIPAPIPGQRDTCCMQQIGTVDIENIQQSGSTPKQKEPFKTVLIRIMKSKNAWIWVTIMFFMFSGMQFANSLYKDYGQTFIYDDHFLALVGAIASIFNCVFRPIWGLVMDKYGFESAVKILCTLCTVLSCTLMYTEKMNKVFFLLWIGGIYGSNCGLWAMGPSVMGKLFGVENISVATGFQFIGVAIGTIAGGFLGLDLQATIGWHWLFIVAGFLGASGFLVSFFFDGRDLTNKPI
ncbi:uncharacterized protein LOC127836293 isoform X2 [Dreissena polymorpha]|uniref:uncharacterized protein LOC127836293 isoform X2 n=1 Tax=Dreissena polymorpha TaxID=45954 RepID=UPI002263C91F|nr:uncharacterized protein LOC127836293 isoform X2 [Dreissena polymorpha]